MTEHLVLLPQILIQLQNTRNITTPAHPFNHVSTPLYICKRKYSPITIIRRTPHRHDKFIEHDLVPLHSELMCSRDEFDVVGSGELFDYVAAKEEACAPWRETPACDF